MRSQSLVIVIALTKIYGVVSNVTYGDKGGPVETAVKVVQGGPVDTYVDVTHRLNNASRHIIYGHTRWVLVTEIHYEIIPKIALQGFLRPPNG